MGFGPRLCEKKAAGLCEKKDAGWILVSSTFCLLTVDILWTYYIYSRYIVPACTSTRVYECHSKHAGVKGPLAGVNSLLPSWDTQGLLLNHQPQPSPVKIPHQTSTLVLCGAWNWTQCLVHAGQDTIKLSVSPALVLPPSLLGVSKSSILTRRSILTFLVGFKGYYIQPSSSSFPIRTNYPHLATRWLDCPWSHVWWSLLR